MPRLEIRPFSAEFVPSAGELLAERHRAHRAPEPLLPERYEIASAAAAEVESLLAAEGSSGAVAFHGGRVVGYVLGTRKDDEIWGANVWIESAGHAVAEPEDLRDLYAAAAELWLEEERPRHYVLVPASDRGLVDAWWRSGFGQQHAHGIREVPDTAWPDGTRRASEDDVPALIELYPVLSEHQVRAPVFAPVRSGPSEEEMRAEILEDLANEQVGDIVAEQDARVVGAFQLVPVELSSVHAGLARPDGSVLLNWAATLPGVRGSGAGVALTEAAFAWAREQGYETMTTDWRVTNLLSSRFWPRRGFRETFLRLYRHIP